MKKSDFDRLLERYLEGEVTEEERIKIEAWLDVAKTKGTDSPELSKDAEDRLFRKITGNLDNIDEIVSLARTREKKLSIRQWILRIAASLLVLMVVSYGVWYALQNKDRLEVASGSEIDKIILSDGSLVWLRGDSKLVYYEKPDEGIRYSELQGEALFEVAKDASRPFIVQCGEVRLRVRGTSFSVKTGNNEVELKVLTGRVNLSSDVNKVTLDVEPNEQVIYRTNGKVEKSFIDKEVISAITEHTGYNMQFSNAPMAVVFKGIEDKFDIKVSLENPWIGNCRITADFTDHSLESTLQMIAEVLGIRYSRNGDLIIVKGDACN